MKTKAILFFIMFLAMVLYGCALPGKCYVAIVWADADFPDGFSCTIPGIPTDIGRVYRGAYYNVQPGDYTVTYSYLPPPTAISYTLSVPIRANHPVLGKENAYYDILLYKSQPPELHEFPSIKWRD